MTSVRMARNRLLRRVFEYGQRARLDVLPRHFYSAIPDIADLRARRDWRQPLSMVNVPGADDLDAQVGYLVGLPFDQVPADVHEAANQANGAEGFGPVEAAVLHAFVAGQQPARVVQIGAGVSTAVILRAAESAGHDVAITCVDPYPTDYLRTLAGQRKITLLSEPAQTVALDRLTDLAAGDMLFIDSTHTVKPGSEVNRLILEVLPRLASGVNVHFHDITWPYDYPPNILGDALFFWTESTLLHAFMSGNSSYSILACLSQLHHACPHALRRLVPWYRPRVGDEGLYPAGRPVGHFPASVYLRRQ